MPTVYEPSFQQPDRLYGTLEDNRAKVAALETEVLSLQRETDPLFRNTNILPPAQIEKPLMSCVLSLLTSEPALAKIGWQTVDTYDDEQLAAYWIQLHRRKFYLDNKHAVAPKFLALVRMIVEEFKGVEKRIDPVYDPAEIRAGDNVFESPLIDLLPDPRATLSRIWSNIVDRHSASQAFGHTYDTLWANRNELFPRQSHSNRDSFVPPAQSTLPVHDMVKAYFGNTPFEKFFMYDVPVRWTFEQRYSHTHILGGSGAGKTTLLEWIINQDFLKDVLTGRKTSMVVIDPHSNLVRDIARSDVKYRDRLIIIDPRDMEHPPAINIFALNPQRMARYDAVKREQVTNAVIKTFNYFFAGLLGTELTPKQGILFRYVTRFLLSFPETMGRNATIYDMLALMEDASPYEEAMAALPPVTKQFFDGFIAKKSAWTETKDQIHYRLQGVVESPTLSRFFTSTETKLDLFTEMNNGAIILIDTAKEFLQDDHAIFGRLWLALVLQAVLERAPMLEKDRHPTFLYVDEAGSYFDSNIDDLLTDARKFRCGCTFAHQVLEKATPQLRASLITNTAIKFASRISPEDARPMAAAMRTTPEFLLSRPDYHWAIYINGVTPHAISNEVWPTPLANPERHLTDAQYAELMVANRRKISLGVPPQTAPSASSPQSEADDISEKW